MLKQGRFYNLEIDGSKNLQIAPLKFYLVKKLFDFAENPRNYYQYLIINFILSAIRQFFI